MQNYQLEVSDKFYNQLQQGAKKGIILPNSGEYKNYKVGNQIEITCKDQPDAKMTMKAAHLYYFETVLEALNMMGKKKLGYPQSLTSTQIEDRLLAIYGTKSILGRGVLVLEVAKPK